MPSKQASEPQENAPPPDSLPEDQVSNRPFWSGTISFGLVSIPVDLYPAVRSSHVSLRMLSEDGTPLSRRYYSPESNKEVDSENMVRGYETAPEEYVAVTDEELERLVPQKSRYIELRQFVEVRSIHPLYFEKAYFLAPSGESTRAYRLLAAVMEQAKRAGIADFVMRGKAYPAAIFSDSGILRLQTLRYYDELRTPEDIGLPSPDADAKTVKHFQAVLSKNKDDKVEKKHLKDIEAAKVLELIERKRRKKEDVIHVEDTERAQSEVVDILETLKRSLATTAKQSAPKSDVAAKRSAPKKRTAKKSA